MKTKYPQFIIAIFISCLFANCIEKKQESEDPSDASSTSHEVTVEGPTHFSGRPIDSAEPNGDVEIPNNQP